MPVQLSVKRMPVSKSAMLIPSQLRAARALLDWSRQDLADRSGTSPAAIQNFEALGSDPKLSTLRKWRQALETAGVEFLDGDAARGAGVRHRR